MNIIDFEQNKLKRDNENKMLEDFKEDQFMFEIFENHILPMYSLITNRNYEDVVQEITRNDDPLNDDIMSLYESAVRLRTLVLNNER
jgi:hypothetical protein